MIRLVFALRRQPHLSRTQFQEYWLNQHAPLVAGFSTDLQIMRYVQTHTLDDQSNSAAQQARGDMEAEYDGVAELWWSSERTWLISHRVQRWASAALLEDEKTFIDLENSRSGLRTNIPD